VAEGDGEGQANGARSGTPDVFISYASQDTPIADAVVAALETHGLKCWIAPRDVAPGTFYADEIVHAIDAAKAIVLILSQNAAASPHVLREVERAASKRHVVITLRTDKAPLPAGLEYFLNTSQWLDASSGETVRALPKLVSAVQLAIQVPALTPSAVPAAQAPVPAMSARSPKKIGSIVASVIGLGLALFAADRLWLSRQKAAATPTPAPALSAPAFTPPAATVPEKSVAVLPFVDMSEKKDQEYFTDGLSEELIDHLARANNLKVIARTSSFQFKGKNVDMRTIGQQLGVAHLLEGSVRKSGKRLRITAQLIRASDGSHLWSQTYDRTLVDVFGIQDQIANAVVQALQVAIQGDHIHDGGRKDNIEAYNLVLQGDFYKARFNAKDMKRAIDLFEQAIKLQPDNARAWARLGSAYLNMGQTNWAPLVPSLASAREALQEALRIDPTLMWAHYTLAGLHMTELDFAGAQSETERMQEIDPSDKYLLPSAIADMKLIHGDLEGALAIQRLLLQRDPLNTYTLDGLARGLFAAQHFEESAAISRRLIQQDPAYAGSQSGLGITLIYLGRSSDALQSIEQETDEKSRLSALPIAYWALGRRVDSNTALEKYLAMHGDDDAVGIAEVHAYRGDFDLALQWLERAYRQREIGLVFIKSDLFFRNIAGDPRFKALLRKMNLPE
jgi:TolB-like protein/Flp pilus assembly protein TadD